MRTPPQSVHRGLPARQPPPSRPDYPLLPEDGKRQLAPDALPHHQPTGLHAGRAVPGRGAPREAVKCELRRKKQRAGRRGRISLGMVVRGLMSKPPFPMISGQAIFPITTPLGLIAGGGSWVARQSAPETHPLLAGLLSSGGCLLAPAPHCVRSPYPSNPQTKRYEPTSSKPDSSRRR